MRLGLLGYGKMGKCVHTLCAHYGHTVTAIVSPKHLFPLEECHTQEVDLFLDFSTPEAVLPNVKKLIAYGKPAVIGTTGWDVSAIKNQKEVGILYASNFSIGVHLFSLIVKEVITKLIPHYQVAMHEEHHAQKLDAPSGTAKNLLSLLPQSTPVTSLRLGSIIGNHELIFDSPFDEIRLSHQAKSRDMYAHGALLAAEWLKSKRGTFTQEDFFNNAI